jgi:microcompartment protein CcmK/EutM
MRQPGNNTWGLPERALTEHADGNKRRRSGVMELGKVVGQVVSTVRTKKLPNLKLLLVDIVEGDGKVLLKNQVAADTIGAGEGELVLLVRGSSARMVTDSEMPMDLSVIGIVDQITSGKKALYTK